MPNGERITTGEIKQFATGLFQEIMRSPFAVLFMVGVILWYASLMSPAQRIALREILNILNNPVGIGVLSIIVLSLLYAMIYPVFAFLAQTITRYLSAQMAIQALMTEHFESSKQMYKQMVEIKTVLCSDVIDRLETIENQCK